MFMLVCEAAFDGERIAERATTTTPPGILFGASAGPGGREWRRRARGAPLKQTHTHALVGSQPHIHTHAASTHHHLLDPIASRTRRAKPIAPAEKLLTSRL